MMAGRIVVETPQDHAAWLMRNSNPAVGERQAPPAPATDGLVTMAEARR